MKNIDFSEFEKKIGITFKNKDLLKQAFTHRSYLNENPNLKIHHNERLEYLGDAVLELVVSDHLYNTFPEKPEGELTSFRAALVNTIIISQAAKELGMNEFLLLSRGEAKDIGKARQYILANIFEAFISALYLDQGYEVAQVFIAKNLFHRLDAIVEQGLWQDSKSKFQEKAQEKVNITPTYKVISEEGPDHSKQFTIGVFLNEEKVAEGGGRSKQEGEQEAARSALELKKW